MTTKAPAVLGARAEKPVEGEAMRCLIALLLTVSPLLLGCNAVGDMKGLFEKQEVVEKAIKETYNLQSRIGWRITTGVLRVVTVVFAADEAQERKVSDLVGIAREGVASSFKSTPQVLNVPITTNGAADRHHLGGLKIG